MCLACKSKQALKKIAERGHENEISITSPSPSHWFVNKCLHVDESKGVHDLSDNFLCIKSY